MHPQMIVQSLQGTRAQIMFAFLFAGHAMDVEELSTWTGRDRKTHYGHLSALCAVGLLAKQTLAHGRDVFLLGSEMLPALQVWAAQIEDGVIELESGLQMSAFRTPGATTTTAIEESKKDKSVVVVNTRQMSAFRTPEWEEIEYETHGVTFEVNLKSCQKFGIGEPKASKVSALPWCSPDLIEAHVKSLDGDERVGLAILRIENNEIPREWLKSDVPKRSALDEKIERLRSKRDRSDDDE